MNTQKIRPSRPLRSTSQSIVVLVRLNTNARRSEFASTLTLPIYIPEAPLGQTSPSAYSKTPPSSSSSRESIYTRWTISCSSGKKIRPSISSPSFLFLSLFFPQLFLSCSLSFTFFHDARDLQLSSAITPLFLSPMRLWEFKLLPSFSTGKRKGSWSPFHAVSFVLSTAC